MSLPFGFSIEADFNGSGWFFLGLVILVFVFILFMNKRNMGGKSQLNHLQQLLILAMRSLAILLLLLLLFSPRISFNREYLIPRKVAILVDQSVSMGQAWEGSEAELKSAIADVIDEIEQENLVDVWAMSGDPLRGDDLKFEKDISLFSWTPYIANETDGGDRYSSVFFISDGHLNGGRSPLDQDWSSKYPIHIVYPLQAKLNAELKILDVGYTFSEDGSESILLNIKLQQEGLIGRFALLSVLTEKDQVIGERRIQLNQALTSLSVPAKLPDPGAQKLRMQLQIENGDLSSEKTLNVASSDTHKSVLIVSERVNALHKFLVQSFLDSSFRVNTMVGTLEGQTSSPQSLSAGTVDLILLNNPGTGVYVSPLADFFESGATSDIPVILFSDGTERIPESWLKNLGLKEERTQKSQSAYSVYWGDQAKDHSFYLGLQGRDYSADDMIKFAPIVHPEYELKSEGVPLLVSGIGTSAQASLTLRDRPPLAIFHGDGFWKWFFHPQSKSSFQSIWEYLQVYLEEIATFSPVEIVLPIETSTTGNYITASISVKDLDHRTIRAAELRVWQLNENDDRYPLDLLRDEAGNYQVQLDTKFPGTQTIIAEAFRFGELWGRDTSTIHLMKFNGESQSRGADDLFLARLASRSGGEVVQYGSDKLPAIPVQYIQKTSSLEFTGLRSSILFALLVSLLIIEWIMRRRNGLL